MRMVPEEGCLPVSCGRISGSEHFSSVPCTYKQAAYEFRSTGFSQGKNAGERGTWRKLGFKHSPPHDYSTFWRVRAVRVVSVLLPDAITRISTCFTVPAPLGQQSVAAHLC